MDRIRDYLRGSSVLLSDAAVICLIVYMIPTCTEIRTISVAVPVWAGFILLQMAADYLMTSAGISFNLYLLINGAGVLAGTYFTVASSFCSGGFPLFSVLLACSVAGVGAHGAAAAWRLPSANTLLRYVDGLVILLAFYLYAVFSTQLDPGKDVFVLTVSAVFLGLFCVNQIRTREEGVSVIQGSGAGSKLVLAAISAGIVAVTGVVTGAASGQVHSVVDALLMIAKSVGKILAVIFGAAGFLLEKILMLLARLLPDAPQEAGETVKSVILEEAEEATETGIFRIPDWVLAAFLIGILFLTVCYILYRFRNMKIKRSANVKEPKTILRKNYFWPAFADAGRQLADMIWFECCYRKYQKTPEGLFICVERIGRKKKIPRRKDESPGGYLRRIAGYLRSENGGSESAMEALAGILDQIYYGSVQRPCGKEETAQYVEAVKRLKSDLKEGKSLIKEHEAGNKTEVSQ